MGYDLARDVAVALTELSTGIMTPLVSMSRNLHVRVKHQTYGFHAIRHHVRISGPDYGQWHVHGFHPAAWDHVTKLEPPKSTVPLIGVSIPYQFAYYFAPTKEQPVRAVSSETRRRAPTEEIERLADDLMKQALEKMQVLRKVVLVKH